MSTERTRIMQEYQAMPAQDKPRHTPEVLAIGFQFPDDTPGTITVDDGTKYHRRRVFADVVPGPQQAANARRIVAAWNSFDNLLEACKATLAHVEDETVERLGGSECTLCNTFRAKLRAAIAAAEQEA